MIVRCAWCNREIIDSHDCPEKRAALLEVATLGELPTVSEIVNSPPQEWVCSGCGWTQLGKRCAFCLVGNIANTAASAQQDEAGDDER